MAEVFRKLSPHQVEKLKQLSQPQLSALEQALRQKIADGKSVSSSELTSFGLEPEYRDTGPRFSAGFNNVNCLPPCGGY